MPIHTRRAASWAVLLFFPLLAVAQTEPSLELDAVTVTASRLSEPSGESPPAVSVVTRADMASRGATTVAQALGVVPGLGLSDKGPEGSQISVTLRGSTTNQVLVLVDGVRVNDALTGLVDLSSIPLDSVERIEVLRGGGSSLYGGDAVGGVVNIITKKKSSPLNLSFENGSYLPTTSVSGFGFAKAKEGPDLASLVDSQKASFSWGPALGETALRVAGSATRAANAYTYLDPNGDRRGLQNASSLAGDASIGATLPLGPGSLSADVAGYLRHLGVPGSESSPTLYATEDDSKVNLVLKYSAERFLSDILSLAASAKLDYSGIDYVDGSDHSNDGHHRIVTAQGEASQRAYVSDLLTLVYGASLSYAGASSDTVGSPRRIAGGAFFESELAVGSLSLHPALRYDYYSDFSANDPLGPIGAALGATLRLSDSDSLKLNLARSYRVPTFNDLYWPAENGAEGNPALKPETGYEGDLGFERRRGAFLYSASAYLRYAEDVILWQPGADGIWRPSNYGAAFYPGIEQELRARLDGGYSVSANYSFLYSYVLSGALSLGDDLRPPMTPVHSLKGSLSHEGERLSWSMTASYSSLRYLTIANVAYLPSHFTLDVIAHWKLSDRTSAYIAGDNLLDEKYEIVDGYPMPGTRIRLGVEFKF
jgi:vitamin B12 transporter